MINTVFFCFVFNLLVCYSNGTDDGRGGAEIVYNYWWSENVGFRKLYRQVLTGSSHPLTNYRVLIISAIITASHPIIVNQLCNLKKVNDQSLICVYKRITTSFPSLSN